MNSLHGCTFHTAKQVPLNRIFLCNYQDQLENATDKTKENCVLNFLYISK